MLFASETLSGRDFTMSPTLGLIVNTDLAPTPHPELAAAGWVQGAASSTEQYNRSKGHFWGIQRAVEVDGADTRHPASWGIEGHEQKDEIVHRRCRETALNDPAPAAMVAAEAGK